MGIETFPAGVVPTSSLADVQARLAAIENGPTRDNLITNGEMESWDATNAFPVGWTSAWVNGAVATTRETGIVARGSASWKTTMAVAGTDLQRLGTPAFLVQPGDIVWYRFRMYSSTTLARWDVTCMTNTMANPPEFFATGLIQQASALTQIGTANTWQEFVYSFAVPAGHYQCRFYINQSLSANGATSFYLDSASAVVPVSTVQDDTGWVAPTLFNNWVNYGGIYAPCAYRRKNGIVYLRGLLKLGTSISGSTLFTLPVGCRPATTDIHMGASDLGIARIDVQSDGTVLMNGSQAGTPSTAWVSVSNIRFPADG